MKKYLIVSIKTILIAVLIVLAFQVNTGFAFLALVVSCISMPFILRGDIVYNKRLVPRVGYMYDYAWSSDSLKKKTYCIGYYANVTLFLSVFLYGTIDNHKQILKKQKDDNRYEIYLQSKEYKYQQDQFSKWFLASKERAKITKGLGFDYNGIRYLSVYLFLYISFGCFCAWVQYNIDYLYG